LDPLADNGGQPKPWRSDGKSAERGQRNLPPQISAASRAHRGEACDIGAFESVLINVFSVTGTNDSGSGSLRQAILSANSTPNS
jgi:hypothetical protein